MRKLGNKPKSEARLQQECYIWFHNNYPQLRGLLFHVNNNSATKRAGGLNKAVGVVAGVSDLLFIYNKTVYCIELKNERGYQSPKQKAWELKARSQGVNYFIVRSLVKFQFLIKGIINGDYE